jgi:hypothetical protein
LFSFCSQESREIASKIRQGFIEALAIETLGEACSQGWRVTVRCSYGRTESPRSQSSRECNYRKELDMETLVWTRGRAFPLSRLESRLRCPRCGSRHVVVLYEPPRRGALVNL